MLDGGHAREKDENIKHIPCFEKGIICKLLKSPHYLGRRYSCKNGDIEKYRKNKRIIKLIDKIRYRCSVNDICHSDSDDSN